MGGVSQVKAALSAVGRYRGVSQLYCRKSRFTWPLRFRAYRAKGLHCDASSHLQESPGPSGPESLTKKTQKSEHFSLRPVFLHEMHMHALNQDRTAHMQARQQFCTQPLHAQPQRNQCSQNDEKPIFLNQVCHFRSYSAVNSVLEKGFSGGSAKNSPTTGGRGNSTF